MFFDVIWSILIDRGAKIQRNNNNTVKKSFSGEEFKKASVEKTFGTAPFADRPDMSGTPRQQFTHIRWERSELSKNCTQKKPPNHRSTLLKP